MPIDKKFIGKEYTAPSYDISRTKIGEYARSIGDLNPLYIDREYAEKSKYGSIVAPPVMAEVPGKKTFRGIYIDLEFKPQYVLHGSQEIEFFELLRPGDEIVSKSYIRKIKELKDKAYIIVETISTNQKGQMISKGKSTIVVLKR